MNPPRKNYLEYQIVRLRLINFHNFVNEIIDLRQGGHLFLVGPNGSGKSTVIDAVHVALSGAQEVELNAAARLGGRKDEGRTLQGVVLRYDRELGALNAGGGISYAALELAAAQGEKRIALGIGLEATTMEARLSRWGFIVKGCGVEELPLVMEELAGQRPATRTELEEKIGKGNVYGQLKPFRKKIAEEFFASESLYEQVVHLWGTGKAYREICARAGDFQTLFMSLLPEPDLEIFAEIIHSLSIIQEFAVTLEQLSEQLRYLERLQTLQDTVAKAREEETRYAWLISYRASQAGKERLCEMDKQAEQLAAETQQLEAHLQAAQDELAHVKTMLTGLRHKDEARLLDRLHAKKEESQRRQKSLQPIQEQVRTYEQRLQRAEHELRVRHSELLLELEQAQHALSQNLPFLKPAPRPVTEFVKNLALTTPADFRERSLGPEAKAAAQAASEQLAELTQEQMRLQHELERHEQLRHEMQDGIARLQQQREWLPQLPDYHQCLQSLEAEGLQPLPLYKLLEWRADDADLRAAVEELLGQQLLGTLVLNGEAESIKAAVLQSFPGIAIAQPLEEEVTSPEWLTAALEDRSGGAALQVIGAALAAREGQQAEYASRSRQLALRGLRWKSELKPARLIGEEARRRAFEQELEQRQAELREQENKIAEAEKLKEQTLALISHWRNFTGHLRNFMEERLPQAFRAHEAAETQCKNLQSSHAEWASNLAQACADLEQLEQESRQLEQHARAGGLEELARSIAALEKREREFEARVRASSEERGRLRHEVTQLQNEVSFQKEQVAHLEQDLQDKTVQLRQYVAEPAAPDLAYYVLNTRGGERFKSDAAIQSRRQEAHDTINNAITRLQGSGEEGVHYRQYAGVFAFSYLPEENQIIDRQHQPLAGVHRRLHQDHAEQQELLNEKNKDLLDRLIMHSLLRHLVEQVMLQRHMIKNINRLLREIDFGGTVYAFAVHAKPEHAEVVRILENSSLLNEEGQQGFRAFIEARLADLRSSEPGTVPPLLDYRTWFDYKLTFRDTKDQATELTRRMRNLGSGGEQAVPNYLLVLAMAHLVFENSRARLRPMLFDEAFYGIDAGRRNRLLEFATRLGMQLFVASPDQDGHTEAVHYATTVFVQKDESRDVHLTALHSHFAPEEKQETLFAASAPLREAIVVDNVEVVAQNRN